MGLSRSSVDVGYENGRWCYVDGHDVICRSGEFISFFCACISTILIFGFFKDFYSFCLTVMVIFFKNGFVLVSVAF